MKVALWDKIGSIKLVDMEEPQVSGRLVKIEVAYCGICDNDTQIINGGYPLLQPPLTLGHEFVGTVYDMGEDVEGYKKGDRVAVNMHAFCGACYYCHNQMEQFCTGMIEATGAYAKYAVVPYTALTRVPDSLRFEIAALTEPLSAAIHGMDKINMRMGKNVAVYGGGAIALMYVMLAQRAGASKVFMINAVEAKRKLSLRCGATVALNPQTEDVRQIILNHTDGRGADYVIECAGSVEYAREAIDIANKGGTILWAASYGSDEKDISFSLFEVRSAKELTMTTSIQSPYSFDRAVDLLQNLNVEPLISGIYDLDCLQEAFAKSYEESSVRVLIKP